MSRLSRTATYISHCFPFFFFCSLGKGIGKNGGSLHQKSGDRNHEWNSDDPEVSNRFKCQFSGYLNGVFM